MLGPNLTRDDVMVKSEAHHILHKAAKVTRKHDFSKGNLVLEIKSEVGLNLTWKVISTCYGHWAIHQTTVLGKGGQAIVLKAQDLITKKWAAVKMFNAESINAEMDFATEKDNLIECERLIDVAKDSAGNGYVLMNYFPGEDLQRHLYTINNDFLKDAPGYYSGKKPYTLLYRARLVTEIIDQIIWLHKKGRFHGDIKPENLVFNAIKTHFDVRLVDLGAGGKVISPDDKSAEAVAAKSKMSKVPGTFGYNDPALVNSTVPYSFKNDYFALGVVIAAVCSKEIYPDKLRQKLAEQKEAGKKQELTFAEIKEMMPDMFSQPVSEPEFELREDKADRELWNEILNIVQELTKENVDERPEFDVPVKESEKYKTKDKDKEKVSQIVGLLQLQTYLKAKVAKMWIEEEQKNPRSLTLSRDRSITSRILPTPAAAAASASAASPRLSGAGVASSRNSHTGVTSPRSSMAGVVPSSSLAGVASPRASVLAEFDSPRKSVLFSNDDKHAAVSSARKLEREYHGDCHPHARQLLKRNSGVLMPTKCVSKNDSPPQPIPSAINLDLAPMPRKPKHHRAKSQDYRRSVTHTLSEDLEKLSITDDTENKKLFRRSMC